MLSPHPLSLLCALLLCLPLALVFTTTPRLSITISTTVGRANPVIVTLNPTLLSKQYYYEKPQPAKPPQLSATKLQIIPQTKPQNPRKSSRPIPKPEPSNSDQPEPVLSSPPPPPPPPIDDADDIRLFRRASKLNSKAHPALPRKIAFMFLTTTPLPFAPLWEQFFSQAATSPPILNTSTIHHHRRKTPNPYYNIYIHADPTYNYTPPFTGVFHNRVILSISKPTHRNTPTLAAAARRLLAYSLLHDKSNHIFILLSSTCIPLHSFHFTYTKLTSNHNHSFIEILANETGAYDRWAARGENNTMLPEVPLKKFRIGSQFWALNRRHAVEVVRDVKKMWRKFKLPCVRLDTCYPEENYFPTLVASVDRGKEEVLPATLMNVDWSGSWDGHPKMYNVSEVGPQLIRKLRDQPLRFDNVVGGGNANNRSVVVGRNDSDGGGDAAVFLFARKFAPECVGPLLNISSEVIFKD